MKIPANPRGLRDRYLQYNRIGITQPIAVETRDDNVNKGLSMQVDLISYLISEDDASDLSSAKARTADARC